MHQMDFLHAGGMSPRPSDHVVRISAVSQSSATSATRSWRPALALALKLARFGPRQSLPAPPRRGAREAWLLE
jgi:hypothetical protein